MQIRPGTPADRPFVGELSGAFAPFGDYRELLPRWTAEPGVVTYIACEKAAPAGFVMVGFYYGDEQRGWCYADVLAIAVVSERRGEGLGRRLLRHALQVSADARRDLEVREVRLTVADTNAVGLRLFRSEGFEELPEQHGRYDGGQVAMRMRRVIR